MSWTRESAILWLGALVLASACSSASPVALASSSTGQATTDSESGHTSESEDSSDGGELPDTFEDECDGFLQDCPAGQKCVPYGTTGEIWDATKCVDVSGDRAPGEPCTWSGYAEATDDCDETSACYEGLCRAFCTGTADAPVCPEDAQCRLTPTLNFCIHPCDPFGDDCPEGHGCYRHDGAFVCLPRSGDAGTGESCGSSNDCPSGHRCAAFLDLDGPCESVACCMPYCQLDDPEACAEVVGTVCEPSSPGIGLCDFP